VLFNGNYDLVQAAAQLFGDAVGRKLTNVTDKLYNPAGTLFGRIFN
jgi:hypothetical protein